MLPAPPSAVLTGGFFALVALMGAAFVFAVWRADRGEGARRRTALAALGLFGWLGLTGGLAASGRLAFGPMPPPMMLLVVAMFALVVALALSPLGRRLATGLPLAALVGFQAFRIAVELLLHRAHGDGLLPVEMTWLGWNYDIVTGLTALLLGLALARGPRSRALVAAWNTLGLVLLTVIVVISILATPIFTVLATDPPNIWITHLPFVWLPTVLVALALLGHLLVFRRLRHEARRAG